MKLNTENYEIEAQLPDNRFEFKIKQNAKMFSILSDGLYSDKISTVIRELSCNAYDAHVFAGKKNIPFIVKLPNKLDYIFSIEDQGTGINPDKIADVYWTYGESSKTNSNEFIGALGLGAKSPFAYTKNSFIVKNRFNGKEYSYICFISETGEPQGTLINTEDAIKPDGITVELAVRPEDVDEFESKAKNFFAFWANKPIIIGLSKEKLKTFHKSPSRKISGDKWYLDSNYPYCNLLAVQGNISYKINLSSIPNLPDNLLFFKNYPFVLEFDIGSLNFAVSREELSYDSITNKCLIDNLSKIPQEIKKILLNISKKCSTKLELINKVYDFFEKFRNHNRYNSDNITFCKFLGFDIDKDYLKAKDGSKVKFNEIFNKSVCFDTPGWKQFKIFNFGYLNNLKRLKLNNISQLKFKAKEDLEFKNIYHRTFLIKKDEIRKIELENKQTINDIALEHENCSHYCLFNSYFLNEDKFDVSTSSLISLPRYKEIKQITFILNDLGNNGWKEFRKNNTIDSIKNKIEEDKDLFYYVDFNEKEIFKSDVENQLQEMINSNLTGARIKYVSDFITRKQKVERRATISKNITLRYLEFVQSTYNLKIYPNKLYRILENLKDDSDFIELDNFNKSLIFEYKNIEDLLKEEKTFIYFIGKTNNYRSKEDMLSYNFLNSSTYINIANYLGLLDEFKYVDSTGTTKFKFLCLNNSEFKKLNLKKYKNIKLVEFSTYIKEKIKKFKNDIFKSFINFLDEKFTRELKYDMNLFFNLNNHKNDKNIKSLLKNLSNKSIFSEIFNNYIELIENKNYDLLLKAYIYKFYFNIESNNLKIVREFKQKYKLLHSIIYSNDKFDVDLLEHILEYVNFIDKKNLQNVKK